MIKKLLIGLSLVTIFSEAQVTLKVNQANNSVLVNWQDEEKNPSNKDWIAIFKKGDATEWRNVIRWQWVNRLACNNTKVKNCHDSYKIDPLPKGEYSVQYLKNNSYVPSATLALTIQNSTLSNIHLTKLDVNYDKDKKAIVIQVPSNGQYLNPNPKDWIGVYRVGDSNRWSNVKAWSWAKKFDKGELNNKSSSYTMDNVTLPSGNYEVRYFLNNTYTHYKKSKPFKIENKEVISQQVAVVEAKIEDAIKDKPMNFDTFITGIKENYNLVKDKLDN